MINLHSKINSKLLIQDKNIKKKFSNFKNKNKFLDDFIKHHKISIERKKFNSFSIKTSFKTYSINTINDFMIKNFISMLHIYFVFHQKLPQKINKKIFPDGRSQIIYNKNKKDYINRLCSY